GQVQPAGILEEQANPSLVSRVQDRVRSGCAEILDQIIDRVSFVGQRIAQGGTAQEHREVFPTVARIVEQRLEQQMLEEVLPPDIDDKCITGLELGYVGEVLVRSHTEVDTALDSKLLEFSKRMQIGRLVGHIIVIPEIPAFLGKTLDQL